MAAIEKLNETNTPFIDMIFRKRLFGIITFIIIIVTKSLRFFEVRKVFDRVKNINLVKYGDVLDKINHKRVDDFGDDGTMDRVLMEDKYRCPLTWKGGCKTEKNKFKHKCNEGLF